MAKPSTKNKQESQIIVGVGKEPEAKLMVQKSVPLFSLWQSDMTLAEFKILDTYLSRINSHEPDKRTVVFSKGELESLLGVKKINKANLVERLKNLGRFVDLQESNSNKIHQVALFEEAYGEMDENGQWIIKLTCTAKAKKYIFNLEAIRYLRYKLHSVLNLKSRYAYILFLYLEYNRYRKSWNIGVDELRFILRCTEDSYNEFKIFNNRILKRCQKEIQEKTDCRFTYEPIKIGRKITAVQFSLSTLSDMFEELPGQTSMDEIMSMADSDEDMFAAVLPKGLTADQIEDLRNLARTKVFWNPAGAMPLDCVIADYLNKMTKRMYARQPDVRRPYHYLHRMIEKEPPEG